MAEPHQPAGKDGRERVGVVVIHGVGETDPGWINDYLVPCLKGKEDNARGLTFTRHSEVFDLPDRGRRRPDAKFKVFLKRAEIEDGPTIALVECFWADLSKVGTGVLSGFVTMMRLFYEAPQILGKAALERSRTGPLGVLRTLILFANWLLRWPITGLSVAALCCAVAVLGLQQIEKLEFLQGRPGIDVAYPIGVVLLLLGALSWFYAKAQQERRDIALSDIAMSTAVCSFILFAAVVAGNLLVTGGFRASVAPYLASAAKVILAFWLAWNHIVALAIVLLASLYVGRLFVWREREKKVPLIRPAAALAMTTAQGIIWKIAIALLWFLLIGALEPGSVNALLCSGAAGDDCKFLARLNQNLFNVIVFNGAMVLILAIAFTIVATLRSFYKRARQQKADASGGLPRLIVSPAIIWLMFALTLFNFYSFYLSDYEDALKFIFGPTVSIPFRPYEWLNRNGINVSLVGYLVGGTTAAVVFYARVAGAVQRASRGLLHIARDLVDHQFTPDLASSRLVRALAPPPGPRHPRRNRIETRLDTLMREVMTDENVDRLVFVAHSQGTVILYDYLQSGRDNESIKGVERIDVLTLGSPLGHLYRHYFDDYDVMTPPGRLNEQLASWTNVWRVDDPIGHRVDPFPESFARNEVLPRGGHLNYWKEDRVCQIMRDLIDPARPRGNEPPPDQSTMAVV